MTGLSPGVRVLFVAYDFCIEVVVWLALAPATWLRARAGLEQSSTLGARLGRMRPAGASSRPAPGAVLIHAVSVGEVHAAAPLIAALADEGCRLILTTGNAAGHEAATRLARTCSAIDHVTYLPWDRRAIRGWLAAVGPSAVVIMETEIWPNLYRACADRHLPLFIANGRIRSGDVKRYRLARTFFAQVLDYATWIGVQSVAERDRFLAIGAPAHRVEVAGHLKADAALRTSHDQSRGLQRDQARPLVVAGSTHNPEERWLLECARLLDAEGSNLQLVLAPRDIRRAMAVAQVARSLHYRTCLWSGPYDPDWDVMVLDQFGVLRTCYADADLVVVGGTFVAVGGHNVFEPAALARPILVGPHTSAINTEVGEFEQAGALLRVSGADPARAIADACRTLLGNRAGAEVMGGNAAALCRRSAGSAAKHARVITRGTAALRETPRPPAHSWPPSRPRQLRPPATAGRRPAG